VDNEPCKQQEVAVTRVGLGARVATGLLTEALEDGEWTRALPLCRIPGGERGDLGRTDRYVWVVCGEDLCA
jgi:hypothetical protein